MISVVVACYNGEKYIEAQLRSVMLQTVYADEVLVFDDGSKDNTTAVVENFIKENRLNGWKLYCNIENKGYCRNFLDGVKETKGDYIFLADQDDVWYEGKIEEMVKVLQADSELKALCCSCNVINGKGEKIPTPKYIGKVFECDNGSVEYFKAKQFIGRSFIRGCSLGFKRELLALLPSLELKGLLSHDWLISFTAALSGKCAVLNKVLMSYRCHGENTSFGGREYGKLALNKRIEAIKYSCDGHKLVLENADCYKNFTKACKTKTKKQIIFENKRIKYLKQGGFCNYLSCFISLIKYKCYYGSIVKGVKVFLGDFLYRKNSK